MSGALLATATYLTNLLTKKTIRSDDLDILIKKVYEYSGLNFEDLCIVSPEEDSNKAFRE